MSEVKRWSIVPYDQYSVDERTSRNGEWVKWKDYEALAAERDRLKAVVDGVRNNIPMSYLERHGMQNIVEAMRDYAEQRWAEKERIRDLAAERDRLVEENERLREAVAEVDRLRDALTSVLSWHDKDKHASGKMTFERSAAFAKARAALKGDSHE